jgi:hypothetical protein
MGMGVGGETPREGEALVEDYGSAEEFLAEELEALEVGEGDWETGIGVRVTG